MNRVCVLSQMDAEIFTRTSIRPPCYDHEHVSFRKARELTSNQLFEVSLPNGKTRRVYEWVHVKDAEGRTIKDAIMLSDVRHWTIRKSGGFDVHQLVKA